MNRYSLYPRRIPTHRARARLFGMAVACILILLLQGCGGGDPEDPDVPPPKRVCENFRECAR